MLTLDHISVSVGEKEIIHDISYTFESGHTYALLGENGSGKSSLSFALFHHPRYTISGDMTLSGESLT